MKIEMTYQSMEMFPTRCGICLHSGDILYEYRDVQNRYSPLDYFLMSFSNGTIAIIFEGDKYKSKE